MQSKFFVVVLALVLLLSLACGTAGTAAGAGDSGPVGESTGDKYILNGDGCPDSFHYIRAGGSYGGCRFEPGDIKLYVYCDPNDVHHTKYFTRFENGPLWREGDTDPKRGLQVFWPGGDGANGNGFACVKERCFDCE